jgi:hypothetical protein
MKQPPERLTLYPSMGPHWSTARPRDARGYEYARVLPAYEALERERNEAVTHAQYLQNLLDNPPEPNAALRAAEERHRATLRSIADQAGTKICALEAEIKRLLSSGDRSEP